MLGLGGGGGWEGVGVWILEIGQGAYSYRISRLFTDSVLFPLSPQFFPR